MKKILIISLTIISILSQTSLANENATIQFFCESSNKPSYEFSIDSDGSVIEIADGHFSGQVAVDELPLRNGDVRVTLRPFHPYCSVNIDYLNHTNNVFKNDDDDGILFSKATLGASCEGGPVNYKECSIEVK